jgi:hypothetical protein
LVARLALRRLRMPAPPTTRAHPHFPCVLAIGLPRDHFGDDAWSGGAGRLQTATTQGGA